MRGLASAAAARSAQSARTTCVRRSTAQALCCRSSTIPFNPKEHANRLGSRAFSASSPSKRRGSDDGVQQDLPDQAKEDRSEDDAEHPSEGDHEHAVISTFDLFSIGIGPSSSHTVGPMRSGRIFIQDLIEASLLQDVVKIRISLYGSLAATGEGHMTPSALLLGLEGADVATVDTSMIPLRFEEIKQTKKLHLNRESAGQDNRIIDFDYDKEFIFEFGKTLPMHSNGMRLTVFDKEGDMLATNDLFSVGGGFVVNGALSTASSSKASRGHSPTTNAAPGHPVDLEENVFYKSIRRNDAVGDRKKGVNLKALSSESQPLALEDMQSSQPPTAARNAVTEESQDKSFSPRYPFRDAASLLALCKKHNLTIAQIVYENERSLGYSDTEIRTKLLEIWNVMDNCIKEGVEAEEGFLPGGLKLQRRAPGLYKRLTRGLYPSSGGQTSKLDLLKGGTNDDTTKTGLTQSKEKKAGVPSIPRSGPPRVHGSFEHAILPTPPRRTNFAVVDYLSVYAISVNEQNAMGRRVVTAPTNGAAGIIPAVLKYVLEFISDDPERDIYTFLLTAAAIGMLYKRGATISAAEGGCQAEVGTSCSMAAAAMAACLGANPKVIEQAAEIGIEHNLGLTCDPIGGLVQAPCIERNALAAVKACSAAQLALSSSGTQRVSLDEAIRAMRLTAERMHTDLKETSRSGLSTSVSMHIPVSVPEC